MEELQFLTEKDLEYFGKLEENGEAVILRLSPEELLSLDLSELDAVEGGRQPDLEEIEAWLNDHGAEIRKRAESNHKIAEENQVLEDALNQEEAAGGTAEGVQDRDSAGLPDNTESTTAERVGNTKQALIERLNEVRLDAEQTNIINRAILEGLEEKQILALLKDGMTVESMEGMLEIFLSLKASSR